MSTAERLCQVLRDRLDHLRAENRQLMAACNDEEAAAKHKERYQLFVMSFNSLADCWVNLNNDGGSNYWKFPTEDKDWAQILDKRTRRPTILAKLDQARRSETDIICLQEVEEDTSAELPYTHALLTHDYHIFYGWNTQTAASAKNGCGVCIRRSLAAGAKVTPHPVIYEGTTALVVSIVKNNEIYAVVSSHLDRGTQSQHVTKIEDTLRELQRTHSGRNITIVWCGDFNTATVKVHIDALEEVSKAQPFTTQYLRMDAANFPNTLQADHILSNRLGYYDHEIMVDYANDSYTKENEEAFAKEAVRRFGSDHKPIYAVISTKPQLSEGYIGDQIQHAVLSGEHADERLEEVDANVQRLHVKWGNRQPGTGASGR